MEIVLTNEDVYDLPSLLGFTVIKLEPSKLDRDSAYGHEAVAEAEGEGWVSDPIEFSDQSTWLVHDSQITFSVQNLDTGVYAVRPGSNPTAEINATGKVVYGYNLSVRVTGRYRITFTSSPRVHFTGQDAVNGAVEDVDEDGLYEEAYIDINVTQGGGGGKPRK